ncbi:MAG: hypothetical protein RR931_04955 [Mucinivorans sp.]
MLYYALMVVIVVSVVSSGVMGFINGLDMAQQKTISILDGMAMVAFQILSVIFMVIMVYFAIVFIRYLILIAHSIKDKDIFNDRLILATQRFAITYGGVVLLCYVMLEVSPIAEQHKTDWMMAIIDCLGEIVTVIVLLIMAQVLKIGNILKQEQELTV